MSKSRKVEKFKSHRKQGSRPRFGESQNGIHSEGVEEQGSKTETGDRKRETEQNKVQEKEKVSGTFF